MFNVEDVLASLDSSFQQGGIDDFRKFLLRHARNDRWIVASDFNIGTKGCAQDIFSFVVYPNNQGIQELCSSIKRAIPYDFKKTRSITREHENFLSRGDCFCFIFLVPRPRLLLRRARPAQALAAAREALTETQRQSVGFYGQPQLEQFAHLVEASKRNSFSLDHYEDFLLLCSFHAFVSGKISFNSPTHLIGWFPDRDRMTTSYQSCWSALAFMMFQSYWQRTIGNNRLPYVSIIDHRVKNPELTDLLDPLIRVPDFFSAVLSRWDRERGVVSRPPDARPEAMGRYIRVMAAWLPENANVWLSVVRFQEEGVTTARIISARTPRRLRRYAQR